MQLTDRLIRELYSVLRAYMPINVEQEDVVKFTGYPFLTRQRFSASNATNETEGLTQQ